MVNITLRYGDVLQSKPSSDSSVKYITVWQGHMLGEEQWYFVTPHGCVSRIWSAKWILDNYERVIVDES